MKRWRVWIFVSLIGVFLLGIRTISHASSSQGDLVALCSALYGSTFGVPNTEPMGACQWDMALIGAGTES